MNKGKKADKKADKKDDKKTNNRKKKFDDHAVKSVKKETPEGFGKMDNPSATYLKLQTVGDEVEGIYKGIKKSEKKNFSDSLILEQPSGNKVLVTLDTNLKDIFDSSQNNIKEGNYVLIVFTEVIAVGKTKTFKRFDVFKKDE